MINPVILQQPWESFTSILKEKNIVLAPYHVLVVDQFKHTSTLIVPKSIEIESDCPCIPSESFFMRILTMNVRSEELRQDPSPPETRSVVIHLETHQHKHRPICYRPISAAVKGAASALSIFTLPVLC